MYANNINGEIKIFSNLPTYWKGVNLYTYNFASSPIAILEEEGFYPIVDPQIDEETEEFFKMTSCDADPGWIAYIIASK